ncbi:MAG: response regulator, partial [Proteobacteria bacterium]|nr:response regulator [Pseudomonadota bacterium]
MKEKYTFLWIDDDKNRKKSLETLKLSLSVDGEFLDVSAKDITIEVDSVLSKNKFDLILIDHFLDNAKPSKQARIKTGSTITEYIREKRPDCPIVGITGAGMLTDIDSRKKSIYEDLLEVASISNNYNSILSIAESYRRLIKKRPKNNDDLIKLLIAPKDVI